MTLEAPQCGQVGIDVGYRPSGGGWNSPLLRLLFLLLDEAAAFILAEETAAAGVGNDAVA